MKLSILIISIMSLMINAWGQSPETGQQKSLDDVIVKETFEAGSEEEKLPVFLKENFSNLVEIKERIHWSSVSWTYEGEKPAVETFTTRLSSPEFTGIAPAPAKVFFLNFEDLASWKIDVFTSDGQKFRSLSGEGNPPKYVAWDGRGDDNSPLALGEAYAYSFTAVDRCRKPVIAAVHSHCIGGGVDLMCVCDIRLASQDAVFSIRETRLAMVADLGTLQRITPIIGEGWARELALTGRDFNAAHALKIGLITHIYPQRDRLYQEAFRMAEEISQLSPITIQGIKETMNFSRTHGVTAGLEYIAQKNSAILPSEDLMEAFQAFMQKRKPSFTGR